MSPLNSSVRVSGPTALKGGIVEWLEAKLPTETKEAPKQAPPEPGALKG